ncbi:MAG: hypothetical protein ACLVKO_12250 [Dysgonomonas sp.]
MEKVKTAEIGKEQIWKFGKYRISVSTNKDQLFITVSRSTLFVNIPICTIVEKLKENSELSFSDEGFASILIQQRAKKV